MRDDRRLVARGEEGWGKRGKRGIGTEEEDGKTRRAERQQAAER